MSNCTIPTSRSKWPRSRPRRAASRWPSSTPTPCRSGCATARQGCCSLICDLPLIPPPSYGGGQGRGRPTDETSKISDLKLAENFAEACPLPASPVTGEVDEGCLPIQPPQAV